jgi:DNA repair exonuclease SbcCD ATPase subunit
MKFKKLELESVFSMGWGEIVLDSPGLTLITGMCLGTGASNGAGKSTLVNRGLVWTLFGQTPGGLKTTDVLNRFNSYLARGVLRFEVGDKPYVITREYTPAKKHVLELHSGDSDISCLDIRDTQDKINKLIGRDLKTFINTEFFGQGNDVPFMKLTPKGQKEIIESFIYTDSLAEWTDNTKKAIEKIRSESEKTELALAAVKAKVETLQTQRSGLEVQMEEFEQTKKARHETITNRIFLIRQKDTVQVAEQAKEKLKGIDINALSTERVVVEMKTSTYRAASSQLSTERRVLEAEKKRIEESINKNECSECGQLWPEDKKSRLRLEEILLTLTTLKGREEVETDNWLRASRELEDIDTKIRYFNTLKNEVSCAESGVDELKSLQIELDNLSVAKNPYEDLLTQNGILLAESLKVQQDAMDRRSFLIGELDLLNTWLEIFNVKIKTALFDRVLPYLEARANTHLIKMNNPQLKLQLRSTTETKSGI